MPNRSKILLVDDESSVLCALKLLLEAMNYSVTDYARAADALAAIEHDPFLFDLFLCDLRMPEINGFEALRRSKGINPNLPFVLMSAHASSSDREHAMRLGASSILSKPFTPGQLQQVLDVAFTQSGHRHDRDSLSDSAEENLLQK